MSLLAVLLVAAGGAIGAAGRYATTTLVHTMVGREFPWGTLAANVSGSFLMGLAFVVITDLARDEQAAQQLRLLLMTGVLGGFTTFSAFSLETLALLEQGEWWRGGLNVVASVGLCLLAVLAGMALARQLNA